MINLAFTAILLWPLTFYSSPLQKCTTLFIYFININRHNITFQEIICSYLVAVNHSNHFKDIFYLVTSNPKKFNKYLFFCIVCSKTKSMKMTYINIYLAITKTNIIVQILKIQINDFLRWFTFSVPSSAVSLITRFLLTIISHLCVTLNCFEHIRLSACVFADIFIILFSYINKLYFWHENKSKFRWLIELNG